MKDDWGKIYVQKLKPIWCLFFHQCQLDFGLPLQCSLQKITKSTFLTRVVTKISSCRVKSTSSEANQTARDFFWFYFSTLFLWKYPGEIPVPRILMTAHFWSWQTGLEIATETVANATNIFSLGAKNSGLVTTLLTSHADVLRDSKRVPAPRTSAEPKDKFLSTWFADISWWSHADCRRSSRCCWIQSVDKTNTYVQAP